MVKPPIGIDKLFGIYDDMEKGYAIVTRSTGIPQAVKVVDDDWNAIRTMRRIDRYKMRNIHTRFTNGMNKISELKLQVEGAVDMIEDVTWGCGKIAETASNTDEIEAARALEFKAKGLLRDYKEQVRILQSTINKLNLAREYVINIKTQESNDKMHQLAIIGTILTVVAAVASGFALYQALNQLGLIPSLSFFMP